MYKQVIVIRSDLKLSKGKLASQAAHASISAYKRAKPDAKKRWENEGQKKVVLMAKNIEELKKIKAKCDELKIPNILITDAGLTEVEPGTTTALGIGPDDEKKIDKITGSIALFK
jgi:PTH2 family peptidyl-tRNA hydrolase